MEERIQKKTVTILVKTNRLLFPMGTFFMNLFNLYQEYT